MRTEQSVVGEGGPVPAGQSQDRALVESEPDLDALIAMIESGNAYLVQHAARILATRGPSAKAAIPALARDLRLHPGPNRWAPIATEIVPSVNEDVARAVLMIEPWGEAAIDAHWRLIRTGRDAEKTRAFAAFERFGPRAVRLVSTLTSRAKRADVTAIRLLGMIGHPAESAVPVLEDWLKWGTRLSGDQGITVVEQVTIALARIRG